MLFRSAKLKEVLSLSDAQREGIVAKAKECLEKILGADCVVRLLEESYGEMLSAEKRCEIDPWVGGFLELDFNSKKASPKSFLQRVVCKAKRFFVPTHS